MFDLSFASTETKFKNPITKTQNNFLVNTGFLVKLFQKKLLLSSFLIGMKTDGKTRESKIIADGDPQKPQAFYPLKDIVTIKPGDSLFARCTYDSTSKSRSTNIGKPFFIECRGWK